MCAGSQTGREKACEAGRALHARGLSWRPAADGVRTAHCHDTKPASPRSPSPHPVSLCPSVGMSRFLAASSSWGGVYMGGWWSAQVAYVGTLHHPVPSGFEGGKESGQTMRKGLWSFVAIGVKRDTQEQKTVSPRQK